MSAGAGSCDRDALLALAALLDARANDLLKTNGIDTSGRRRSMRLRHAADLLTASSRIRRALGGAANGLPASRADPGPPPPPGPQVGGGAGGAPRVGAHEKN